MIYEWDPTKAVENLKRHSVSFDEATTMYGSSVRSRLNLQKPMPTKNLASGAIDELRSEYDLASLTGRIRGKYYARATAGTTLVLLEPDMADAFPDGTSVNKALRLYLRIERGKLASKRLHPSAPSPTTIRKAHRPPRLKPGP